MSLRRSSAVPRACSGLMYRAVPRMIPCCVIAGPVDLRDVLVIQGRERLRFAFEARHAVRIRGEDRGKDLDGDGAIEPRVARAIHLTHAARAERADDLAGSDTRAGGKAHGGAKYTPSARGPPGCSYGETRRRRGLRSVACSHAGACAASSAIRSCESATA
jgi:hypothetical protein